MKDKHNETSEGQTMETCDVCRCHFRNGLDLEWHIETEHEQSNVSTNSKYCLPCSFVCTSQESLEMDILSEHAFLCRDCEKVIPNITKLEETHSGLNCTNCDQCESKASSVKSFVTHLLSPKQRILQLQFV